MQRRLVMASALVCAFSLWIAYSAFGQQPAQGGARQGQAPRAPAAPRFVPEDHRPPMFLHEAWKHHVGVPEGPATKESVASPNLEINYYGDQPGKGPDKGIWENQRDSPKDDPDHMYTGTCRTPCALGLRDKDNYVDLTGLAKIRWQVKMAGFHQLRPIVKLADGTWLVGDHADGWVDSFDWYVSEFSLASVRWRALAIDNVVTGGNGNWVEKPDLSKVDEVGFADLMPGNISTGNHGSAGFADIGWVEVYGNPVKRVATTAGTK